MMTMTTTTMMMMMVMVQFVAWWHNVSVEATATVTK